MQKADRTAEDKGAWEGTKGIPSKEDFSAIMDKRFSPEVYDRLKAGKVGIAGLGGLGSHIAVMLARSGVGRLHLVDFDRVDLSNLNRQEYRIRHLGRPKTEALKEQLLEINPYLAVTEDCIRVTEENAADIFKDDDIICEAFDGPENKAMLVNAILSECPEKKLITGSGMAGFESSNTIKTRRIMKNWYMCGDETTDALSGIGLMAARVSICAGHEANMVIRLLEGLEEV